MSEIKKQISNFVKSNQVITNVLGHFQIGKVLGEGGTSIVRETTLVADGEKEFKPELAIKFLAENIKEKESKAFKRFKQAHINLLLIQNSGYILPQIHFDSVQINEDVVIPYILLKKSEMTLNQFRSENEIDFELFEKIFKSLLNCIGEIQKHGIIHRDLKPDNIFIVGGKLVIGDFDIACFNDIEGIKLIETKGNERLANHLFSAPEQSEKSFEKIIQAADWYAFGQILYWLWHNKTLRGQGPVKFTQFDDRLKKYELLVSNLLSQDPATRLESKEKIVEFLKTKDQRYQDHLYRIEKEKSLNKFDDIIYKYYSSMEMSGSGFQCFRDSETISEIMDDLKKEQDSLDLWLSQGYLDSGIKSINELDEKLCWLLNGYEFKLKYIWIYKHRISYGGSFLILEIDHRKPCGVYKNPGKVEEVGLYNNKHYVSRQEYDAGWAIIDGKRVEINGNTELRLRYLKPDIHFLAPTWGLIVENIKLFDQVYTEYKKTYSLNEATLLPLKAVRRKLEVQMYD